MIARRSTSRALQFDPLEGRALTAPLINVEVTRSLNDNSVDVRIIRDVDVDVRDVNVVILGTQRR